MRGRGWAVMLFLILLAGGLAGGLWLRDRLSAEGPDPGIVRASGRIESRTVRVASTTGGRVLRLAVHEGDAVEAGQLIAELDERITDAALAGARAAVEAARANVAATERKIAAIASQLALARLEATRYHRLYERDAVPRQAAERADAALEQLENEDGALRAALELARHQVDVARAQHHAIEVQRDEARVRAPLSGSIEAELVREGEIAPPGVPIVMIRRDGDVTLRAYLPLAEAERVRPGLEVRAFIEDLADRFFAGSIERVAREAEFTPKDVHMPDERSTLVFAVDIRVANIDGVLKDGFPADVYIRINPAAAWPERPPW